MNRNDKKYFIFEYIDNNKNLFQLKFSGNEKESGDYLVDELIGEYVDNENKYFVISGKEYNFKISPVDIKNEKK